MNHIIRKIAIALLLFTTACALSPKELASNLSKNETLFFGRISVLDPAGRDLKICKRDGSSKVEGTSLYISKVNTIKPSIGTIRCQYGRRFYSIHTNEMKVGTLDPEYDYYYGDVSIIYGENREIKDIKITRNAAEAAKIYQSVLPERKRIASLSIIMREIKKP